MACLVLMCYCLVQATKNGGHDFSNSYFGALFFSQGEFDTTIFDPYAFNKKIYDSGHHYLFVNYNPNPPSTSIFFLPFTLFNLHVAKLLFNLISTLLFIVSIYRLCRHLKIDVGIVGLYLPIVLLIPIRNQILFGQTYFLIFALLAEGYIAHEKRKLVLSSILWSMAIFIKVFPAILLLFILLKKDWKQVFYMGVTCMVILTASILLQGIDVWMEYLLTVLPRNNRGEIQSAYLTNYQSALMLFKYLFIREEVLNPTPLIDSPFLFKGCLVVFKAGILALCSLLIIHRKDILAFGVTLFAGMLISPYGSSYSNILLLFILFAVQREGRSTFFWVTMLLIFLISNLPLGPFQALPLIFQFPRLLLMIILFVYLFAATTSKMKYSVLILYIFILGIPTLLQRDDAVDTSTRLLSDEKHNLIFDYGLKNGFLYYNYWEGESKIQSTEIPVTNLQKNSVFIKNNQVFYKDNQLTNSSDNKIKPGILNSKSIIYLSDKDKGIGFYTIRVISLPNQND